VHHARAVGAGEGLQRADLVQHVALDVGGIRVDAAPAEAAQIGKAGMRTHRDAGLDGEGHSAVHDRGVAGVKTARDGVWVAGEGREVRLRADTLCPHGDNPEAVANARAVRQALERAGVEVCALAL